MEKKMGRPRQYKEQINRATGFHPDQEKWLAKQAKKLGVSKRVVIRDLVWDAMEAEGVKIPEPA